MLHAVQGAVNDRNDSRAPPRRSQRPAVAQVLQQLLFKRVIVEFRIVRMATDPDSHLWLGELETRKLVGIVDALRLFEPRIKLLEGGTVIFLHIDDRQMNLMP